MKEAGIFWREIFHCAGHRWWLAPARTEYRNKRWGGRFISKLLPSCVEECGFERFTIPLGVKTPSVLVFSEDWSLKDPLLLFVAVVRYPAVMSHFSKFALFVALSWQW